MSKFGGKSKGNLAMWEKVVCASCLVCDFFFKVNEKLGFAIHLGEIKKMGEYLDLENIKCFPFVMNMLVSIHRAKQQQEWALTLFQLYQGTAMMYSHNNLGNFVRKIMVVSLFFNK